ncbi:MAG: 30S ribosomal protein S18 [Kiritimatiellia bacterium]|nr:30S ribosomal protein S18 [Kiritimatiellia bacterium]
MRKKTSCSKNKNQRDKRDNLPFFTEEKRSRFLQGIPNVDFKDSELLKKFATEQGKILPRRICGTSSRQQRQIKRAIRRARIVGLMR